jgi:heme/copper-type cytochrome/quinol oxidase subunit 4
VIEQGWTEPFIAGAFGLFLWLRERRRGSLAPAAAYGFMLSLKQYLVFFVLHLFMIERRGKALTIAAVTGFLTCLPFLVWDPVSFYTYGVRFQLETAFRPDGLTIVALFHRLFGLTAGKWLAALVGLGVALYTYRRFLPLGLVGYLLAVTLTTFSIFLFGSQAFCNYYYLVSVLCLFVFAVHARPA